MSPATPAFYACEDDARSALIETCLRFEPLGLSQGKSGNASVRWHRGALEGMLITPSGLDYSKTAIDDIAWVPLEQPGTGPDPAQPEQVLAPPASFDGPRVPSSEWRMHRAIYLSGNEAGSVVHVHSTYASSLACLPRIHREGIPAFHYMIAVAGGHDIRCAPYSTFGTQELATGALAALRDRRACLLANHGQLALGGTLSEALALAVEVETLACQYGQALQIGEPVVLDTAEMARVLQAFRHYGR